MNFNYNIAFAPKQFYKKLILESDLKCNISWGRRGRRGTYNLSFPYRDGMQKGVLIADIEAIMGNKTVAFTPAILNTNGVKEWKTYMYSLPNNPDAIPLFTETFVKDVPATGVGIISGYVLFPLSKSVITDAQKKSSVMAQAAQEMKKILADKNAKITNMLMYVSSSPEGPERLNKNLTTNRFNTAKAYFMKDLGIG